MSDRKTITIENDSQVLGNFNKRVLLLIKNLRLSPEMIKLVGEGGKALFLIDAAPLFGKGVRKAIFLSQLRDFLKYCVKYHAFYSFVENGKEIEDKEKLVMELEKVGLNRGQVEFALEMLQHY